MRSKSTTPLLTAALPVAALLVLACSHPAMAQVYYLYVANESDDTVSLVRFDQKEAASIKTIPVGSIPTEIEGPHGLTVSPDGEYWYVSLAHGQPYGSVVKYRTTTDERIGSVALDLFPATMQISVATGLLYVVNFNLHGPMEPSSVSVVDPSRMIEVGRVTTGAMPHGSRLSPEGTRHYSVSMMGGMLYEVDALSLEVSRSLQVGQKPTWVEHHPHTDHVYVADNGGDEIVEVDLGSWAVTRRIASPGAPYNLALAPDGSRIFATLKSAGAVGVYNASTGDEVARLETTRRIPHGVTIAPDGKYAFITAEGIGSEPGSVDVVDLRTLTRVATADVGRQAGGIALWKTVPSE